MFESIISEAESKLNLDGKAEALLPAILGLFTNTKTGGFSGLLDRFKTAGLGDLANSWINTGANTPISKEQTESAIGEDALKVMSDETGLDYDKTTGATAFMLPRVVDELTPNGEVPDNKDLLGMITGFLGGIGGAATAYAGDKFDRVDASVSSSVDAGKAVADKGVDAVGDVFDGDGEGENSILKWLLPLLILGILVALGFWFCGKSTPVVTNGNTNMNKANANANSAK